jgi:hypothetical protein
VIVLQYLTPFYSFNVQFKGIVTTPSSQLTNGEIDESDEAAMQIAVMQ